MSLEVAVLCAQIVADYAVDDERSVDFARRREDLAAGQVAPFLRGNDAAGLEPLVVRIEVGGKIGAGRGGRANLVALRTISTTFWLRRSTR